MITSCLSKLILIPLSIVISACSTLSGSSVLAGSPTSPEKNVQDYFTATPSLPKIRPSATTAIEPTPTIASLSTEGPWLVFTTNGALWATDGKVAREFYRPPKYYPLSELPMVPSFAAAPNGARLAFSAPSLESSLYPPQQSLFLVQFPAATPTKIADLISLEEIQKLPTQFPGDPLEPRSDPWYQGEQIRAAVSRKKSIAWSPDGKLLAVVAARDAPNTDLYTYDLLTGKMTRLTSGPYQTADLSWSPNGRSIVHSAISDINIGRSGTDNVEGVWAANPYSNDVVRLGSGQDYFIEWIDNQTALLYTWLVPCSSYNLISVDTGTGESKSLWAAAFNEAAVDPETGTILVGVSFYDPDSTFTDVCHIPLQPNGLYIIKPGQEPIKIAEYNEGYWPSIIWSADAQTFFVNTPAGVIQVTSSGQISPTKPHVSEIPIPSPNGEYWAVIDDQNGLSITSPNSPTKINVSSEACQAIWKPDAKAIYFTDYTGLYVAEAPAFKPQTIFHYSDSAELCWANWAWVTR